MKTLLTFQDTDAPINVIDDIANTALNLDAHLQVFMVGLATLAPVSVYSAVPAYDWSAGYTQVIQDTHQRTIELSEYLNKMGVSASVVPLADSAGSVPGVVADSALFADFAVVPADRQLDDMLRTRFLEGALFSSNTPTLLLPPNRVVRAPMENVVIAWHPSPNAAAAIRSSLPLIGDTTNVSISIVDSSPGVYGHTPGSEIATFLARHNIKATVELLSSNGKPIGEILNQHALDLNADLLVMGAYGRSRFREWLMGGTTKDVFESLALPTLVSH